MCEIWSLDLDFVLIYTKQKRVDLIIGADTVVTMDGQIYEKPKDDEDAFRMLSRYCYVQNINGAKKYRDVWFIILFQNVLL